MRVLFLSNESRQSQSAYAHRLRQLQHAIADEGVSTDFFSLRDAPISRPILAMPLNLPVIRKKLADCDFIHAGGDASYVASLWKPFTRASVICDVHGDTVAEAQMQWAEGRRLRTAHQVAQSYIAGTIQFRLADRFLYVSRPMQSWLNTKGRQTEDAALIRNGVDLALFRPAPPPQDAKKHFVIAYAGGFALWQGIENLIQAMEVVADPNIRLRIIGLTSAQDPLANQIRSRLKGRVELHPRVDQAKLVQHLQSADAMIIPRSDHRALRVALPTKFAEYLALGKPVIVSDVDETADLVRRHDCGIVAEPNPHDLAQAIGKLAKLTDQKRTSMGVRSRRLAEEEFSWHVIGQKYVDHLVRWHEAIRG